MAVRWSDINELRRRMDQMEDDLRAVLTWVRGDFESGKSGAEDRLVALEDGVIEIKGTLVELSESIRRREKRDEDREIREEERQRIAHRTSRLVLAALALLGIDALRPLVTLVRTWFGF